MRVKLVRRGDVLIVKCKRPLTQEQAGKIREHVNRVGIEALVFSEDFDLGVKRRWWWAR